MIQSKRRLIYLAVFVTGMAALAVELTASRLVGTIYGNSNLVWASIIGLILVFLAVGYFLGGRLADRKPTQMVMYQLMFWGGFATGFIPIVAKPIMRIASNAFDQLQFGILVGSFVVVLILLIIPMTLLGMVSPYAIRLSVEDTESSGKISGQLYAVSTIGSFIGAFLPVIVLIPTIGTFRTFVIFGLLTCLTALTGLWFEGWRKQLSLNILAVAILVGLFVFGNQSIKNSQGQIYETESAYNYIQVLQQDGYHLLRLNEGQGIHSEWHPTQLFYGGPWEQFLAAPFFNAPDGANGYDPSHVKRIAIIGLAAGTSARQASAVFGAIPIDGYEIDPTIIEVGKQYFGMDLANLNAQAVDGRWGITHSNYKYDLIIVDAYRPPYIPWHLTTLEFFQIVAQHLNPQGVLAINVGRAPNDRRLIAGFCQTLGQIFPSLYVMDLPDTFNSIIYATMQPTTVQNFYRNLLAFYPRSDIHPLLLEVMQRFVLYQKPIEKSTFVFTDDRAPIEWLTNNLVLNFILSGEVENLQ